MADHCTWGTKNGCGITLHCDKSTWSIWLSQMAFIDKIIARYHQSDAKPALTPMVPGAQLLTPNHQAALDEGEQERLNALPYCPLVGSLMYVASGS